MKNIVIVGAGFAGIFAAKNILSKLPGGYQLVLINKSSNFTFKPLLHEVATGAFNTDLIREDISAYLHHENFEFVRGEASKIDLKKQSVVVDKKIIDYDYVIIAIGAETNFFSIPGAEEYALKLDSIDDSFKIKNALVNVSRKSNPKLAIIGGGSTGIELSTEVAEFVKQLRANFSISIIERASILLPQAKKKFRNLIIKSLEARKIKLLLQTSVIKIGKNFILTNKNEKIAADLIIWAAGVKPASVELTPNVELPKGHFPVDSYLRLKNSKNVFAIGDCALAFNPDGKPIPKLAQSATQQGRLVAENIIAAISSKPLQKYIFKSQGFVIPLGKGYAVAEVKGFVFSGFFAWTINRFVYIINMCSPLHKFRVAMHWTFDLFRKRDTQKIAR